MNQSNILDRVCLEHPENKVLLACFNGSCLSNRLVCSNCLSCHSGHINQLVDSNHCEQQILELQSETQSKLTNINSQINELINLLNQVKKKISLKHDEGIEYYKQQENLILQKKCNQHQDQQIILICLNKTCYQNKYLCSNCIQFHAQHLQNLSNINKIKENNILQEKNLGIKLSMLHNYAKNLIQQLQELKINTVSKYTTENQNIFEWENKVFNLKINLMLQFTSRQNNRDQQKFPILKKITQRLKLFIEKLIVNEREEKQIQNQTVQEVIIQQPNQNIFQKQHELLQKSQHYYESHQYQKALELLIDLTLNSNENKILYFIKAESLMNLNKYQEISNLLQQSNSNRLEIFSSFERQRQLGQYEESIILYDQSLSINSKNKLSFFGKGESLKSIGKFQEAIDSYNLLLQIDKDNIYALQGKGESLIMLQKYFESIEIFEKILSIDIQFKDAFFGKGEVLRILGKFKESIFWYDKALEICQGQKFVYYGKGDALRRLGYLQDSIKQFNMALQIDPKYIQAILGKGDSLRLMNQIKPSLDCYNQVLQIDQKCILALFGKVIVQECLKVIKKLYITQIQLSNMKLPMKIVQHQKIQF